jgi:hypothetical protein
MQFTLENLEAEKILQKIIHAAAEKSPVGSGLIIYLVDTVLFPEPKDHLWSQMEGKVQAMMDARLDQVVTSLAANSATNLLARLKSLGSQLQQFRYLTDRGERKMRLAVLVSQIESAVAECSALPNAHLLAATDVLRPLALAHIALLFDQKTLEPHRYEHQAALNHTAIMYSDLAARLYERARWWRLSLVAEGEGRLVFTDLFVNEVARTKKVQIAFYDRFAQNRWQPGERGMAIATVTTGTVPMDKRSDEFEDAKAGMESRLAQYGKTVEAEYEALWNAKLLGFTMKFMDLVDWPVVKREERGEVVVPRRVYTFPVSPLRETGMAGTALDRLELFLEQQMDQFALSGPRYVQTYRLPAAALEGPDGRLHFRADTYDTAVACIFFQERGRMDRAADLADGLVAALNHDDRGGGRIVAATRADELLDRGLGHTTSTFHDDGPRRDVGNMSWAGLALTRMYHRTRRFRYLHAAETIGRWITANCTVNDGWGGFSGGEDAWGGTYPWRSVEHNVDAFSFFANLHHLTGDTRWAEASAHARRLVLACRVEKSRNVMYYVTGTTETMALNESVVPTDTQSWTALAGIDPGPAEGYSLIYMLHNMDTESAGYPGTRFAQAGKEVQNEATAGAAMALWLSKAGLQTAAERYYDSLVRQISGATNGDGYGLVATPAAEAETGPGLGWKYFNYLHVASSAWTGLALLAKETPGANPYASLKIVGGG